MHLPEGNVTGALVTASLASRRRAGELFPNWLEVGGLTVATAFFDVRNCALKI